jgi:hypothetical protein
MAGGRKPQQVHDRAFGDEVIAIACVALAIFFFLAFSSYQTNDPAVNRMGLIGYVLAELVRPMLGQLSYALPVALTYGAALLLQLLPFPAPIIQSVAFLVLTLSIAACLALESPGAEVAAAGGWMGGFLAELLRKGLNRLGAYVVLVPVLLVSFMVMLRISIRDSVDVVGRGLSSFVSRLRERWRRDPSAVESESWGREDEEEPPVVKPRSVKKEAVNKKAMIAAAEAASSEEEEEENLPPIIISRPPPPPTASRMCCRRSRCSIRLCVWRSRWTKRRCMPARASLRVSSPTSASKEKWWLCVPVLSSRPTNLSLRPA